MNLIIQLKKVQQKDLNLFKIVLDHHSTTMQFLNETLPDRKYAKDMSIAVETWYEFNQKTSVQFPKIQSNIKLSLHKTYILIDALNEYSRETDNEYEKNQCLKYMFVLDEQLPTATQLAIK
jgi:cytochrome oxidase Cu insertion factor (SCO1/SenC/PrrC family)